MQLKETTEMSEIEMLVSRKQLRETLEKISHAKLSLVLTLICKTKCFLKI